ncbi:MAG: dephospho-CoA kinase [Verrucomicrobiota bacterium]|jgi:dephospho-CoA kinase
MPAIGITGGISTGKTAFCDCLREIVPEAKFFNADKAARELVDLDKEVKEELLREFGPETYFPGGDLNRERLRAIVFVDAAKKSALEQILHPRIRQQWSAEAKTHRNAAEFFFADIPLLYETGGETFCDRVVVVACSREIQFSRLWQRSRLDRAVAGQIIDSQMPLNEKISRADHVVWNNGERAVLKEQAKALMELWRA